MTSSLSRLLDRLVPSSRFHFLLWLLLLGLLTLGGVHLAALHEYSQGILALEDYEFSSARRHFERCIWVWPSSTKVLLRLARIERLVGSPAKAETYLNEIRALGEENSSEYRVEMLLFDFQNGQLNEVTPRLMRLVDTGHPESDHILATMAVTLMQLEELDHARMVLGRWEKLHPDNGMLHESLGTYYLKKQLFTNAIPEFERALQSNPKRFHPRLMLCEALIQTSQFPLLNSHLEFLQTYYSDKPDVQQLLARYLVEVNRFQDADEVLSTLLEANPNNPFALVIQAKSCVQQKQYERAVEFLDRALAVGPATYEKLYLLERCLTFLRDPRLPKIHAEVEIVRARNERMNAMHLRMQKRNALTLDEKIEYAELLFHAGADGAAAYKLSQIVKTNPNIPKVHQILVEFYEKHHDLERAEYHRKFLQSLSPFP